MSEIKREILRKLIHFSGLIYIPAYLHFGREFVVVGIILALMASSAIEYLRLKHGLFSHLTREYEKVRVGAHIYYGFAILLVTILFPRDACFVSVSVSLIGDGLAGIVKRTNLRKLATPVMIVAPLIFIVVFPLATTPAALAACVVGAIVERVEKVGGHYVQDNLSVPLAAAITYEITKYIIT